MELDIEKADVYAAGIEDKPGGLAKKLTTLSEAGADLDFIIARRSPDRPGTGVVFVTPLRGDRELRAATAEGFTVSRSIHSVRVEGENRPGVGAQLCRALSHAGLNMRGFSAAVIGTQYVIYFGFDSSEDADRAIEVLKKL